MRKAVAVLCMALAVMLSGQAYISLIDRMEHAHHHAHFADPLAGDISFAAHEHGAPGDHHHGNAAQHQHGTNTAADHPNHGHGAGRSHIPSTVDHVHGDAAVVFLAAQSFVLVGCPLPVILCESEPQDFASFSPRGPDHPPKTSLEIRV